MRWPTTIGAWKREKVDGEVIALRYKASPIGRRCWRDLVVAPAWFADDVGARRLPSTTPRAAPTGGPLTSL